MRPFEAQPRTILKRCSIHVFFCFIVKKDLLDGPFELPNLELLSVNEGYYYYRTSINIRFQYISVIVIPISFLGSSINHPSPVTSPCVFHHPI